MYRKFAAVSAGLMLVALLARRCRSVLGASAPAGASTDTSRITVAAWQAALIAIGYYWPTALALRRRLFHLVPPLVAGFFVGLILGDPPRARSSERHQRALPRLHLGRREPAG